ncbi:MAG: DUF547 domain-containing protein [Bacteroidota bacterium]
MNKIIFSCGFILLLSNIGFSQSTESFFERYDQFLSTYTNDGGIDFDLLKTQPEILNQVYEAIGNVNLDGKSASFKKAFLINAYNILVIKQEEVFYPIKSPNEVNGFFDNITHIVAGKEYTLDGLEKQFLLKEFPDPRVHLVLVCGAKGCPKLLNKAYRPQRLDDQIDEQVKTILNDPEFLIVNKDQSEISLSEIFKWYKDDFTENDSDILDFINKYRIEKLSKKSAINFYAYDWSINTMSKED